MWKKGANTATAMELELSNENVVMLISNCQFTHTAYASVTRQFIPPPNINTEIMNTYPESQKCPNFPDV
jgi:hypothetical protein